MKTIGYLYHVSMELDIPNEPGEHVNKSFSVNVVAPSVEHAIDFAKQLVPVEVSTQVRNPDGPSYTFIPGPTRAVRGVLVTSCTQPGFVHAVHPDMRSASSK